MSLSVSFQILPDHAERIQTDVTRRMGIVFNIKSTALIFCLFALHWPCSGNQARVGIKHSTRRSHRRLRL
ncbi:hypothetical protein I7I48_08489 [Histoplasma ohiense]|nr:hypothetical protein I7I48_08489 [Histoplasma ohiense (nom. inval.)]